MNQPRPAPQPVLQDDFLSLDHGPQEGDDGQLELAKYLRALRRRWPLILICCLLAGAYALIRYTLTTKQYQATTVIQIERRQLATVALGGQTSWLEEWWNTEYYPTQYRLLRSRGMAERVVQNLRLTQDPAFTGRSNSLVTSGEASASTAADDNAALARYASKLRGGLSVNPIRETQLVELTYRSSSADLAARAANGYAEAFIEWGIETRSDTVSKASSLLEDQIGKLGDEIERLRTQVSGYGGDTEFALDPAGEALLERQKTLQGNLNQVVANRLNKQSIWNQYKNGSDDKIANAVAGTRVVSLRSEVNRLDREYNDKLNDFRPEWPDMVNLKEQVDTKRSELASLVQGVASEARDQASAEYQQALGEEQAINGELRRLQQDAESLNSTALQFRSLRMQLESKQEQLAQLFQRQSETDFASRIQDSRESNVRIVDRAIMPGAPFKPVLKKDLTTALFLGFLVGAGLIVLIEFLDRTIKTPEDLERITGLPTLTVIPDVAERNRGYAARLRYGGYGYGYGYGYGQSQRSAKRRGSRKKDKAKDEVQIELLPHHRPRLAVCEAYRSLRTALLLSSAEELKSVVVTSAEPGEGKTSTTVNLAVVMAQLGRNVVVVDCDLRRPRMHKVFDTTNRTGVVNHLTGTEQPDNLIVQTQVPNLYLCPCGPIPPNPSELLASDRMREFITALRDRFDFVLIDTPPVLPVVDAAILGQLVDGIVITVRAGHLVRDHAKVCRERLRFGGIRLLGTVMNRFNPSGGSRYAKHYYYANTYSEENAEAAEKSSAA